jgi:hypothetical protein
MDALHGTAPRTNAYFRPAAQFAAPISGQPTAIPGPMGPASAQDAISRPGASPASDLRVPTEVVMWGVDILDGFDELYDPWHSRGQKGHAFPMGDDTVALCGHRPGKRMLLARRQVKLGLPSAGLHPVCGKCAKRVTSIVRRMAVPVAPAHASVPVPIYVSPAGVHARAAR